MSYRDTRRVPIHSESFACNAGLTAQRKWLMMTYEVVEPAGALLAAPDEAGTAEVTAPEAEADAPVKQPLLPAWTVRPDE